MKRSIWIPLLVLVLTCSFQCSAEDASGNRILREIAVKYGGAKTSADSADSSSSISNGIPDTETKNAEEFRRIKRLAAVFSQTLAAERDGTPKNDPNIEFRFGNLVHLINALKCYGGLAEPPTLLVGENLVKDRIEEKFDELEEKTSPGDEIFIYWEGHGVLIKGHEYFVLYDYRIDNTDGMIRGDHFIQMINEKLKGRKVMFFLEVCHSGQILKYTPKSLREDTAEPRDFHFTEMSRASLARATTGEIDYTESIELFKRLYSSSTKSLAGSLSPSGESQAERIMDSMTSETGQAKEFESETAELAVICSCSEDEKSYCGVSKILSAEEFEAEYRKIEKDENLTFFEKQRAKNDRLYLSFPGSDGNSYPISPSVCALVAIMQDKDGYFREDKSCGRFSDVADLMETFLPKNAARLSNFKSSQTPAYSTTIPDICVSPAD